MKTYVGKQASVKYLSSWVHGTIHHIGRIGGQVYVVLDDGSGDYRLFHPWEVFIDGTPLRKEKINGQS